MRKSPRDDRENYNHAGNYRKRNVKSHENNVQQWKLETKTVVDKKLETSSTIIKCSSNKTIHYLQQSERKQTLRFISFTFHCQKMLLCQAQVKQISVCNCIKSSRDLKIAFVFLSLSFSLQGAVFSSSKNVRHKHSSVRVYKSH